MVVNPEGCLTSLERLGRRGFQTAVIKFSMSWTSEQNSTHWGGSQWRIFSRLRTGKVSCTTGVRESINLHWEIKCLYYFQRLAQNYSQSCKDLFWLHGEWGISIKVKRMDRGDSCQIYHLNLLKRWNDVT